MDLLPTPVNKPWERFVALGDSFPEGLDDVDPRRPDTYVGWADRLAAALAARNAELGRPFAYANLAVRGRLIADVVEEQLEPALAMSPDLVVFSAGGNDLLQSRTAGPYVVEVLEQVALQVRAIGADLVLVTAPDISWIPLVGRLNQRMVEYTAHVWAVAQRTGSRVVDIYTMPSLRDLRMYADDRIHLSAEGHARVAAQALWTLGLPPSPADWRQPLPALPPVSRWDALRADREWLGLHLWPWLGRLRRGEAMGEGRPPKRPQLLPWEERQDLDASAPGR